jgi:hypothetical protein
VRALEANASDDNVASCLTLLASIKAHNERVRSSSLGRPLVPEMPRQVQLTEAQSRALQLAIAEAR